MASLEESSYVVKDKIGAEEISRLNLQHEFLNIFANREYLHSSIPLAEEKKIADVATGSGIWLLDLAKQLQHDGLSREYTGFDMTLSQAPASHPDNVVFVEHNILVPFPEHYIGIFDVVHVRLLGGALTKTQIPAAVVNVMNLIKPGGYLQWDDIDSTMMRAIPPNPLADEIYNDVMRFGNLLGMDLKFPYAVEKLCKSLGMKDVQVIVTDSLGSPEMVAKTREIACLWYLDCVTLLIPLYYPVLKGATKEEAVTKRDELVESLKGIYAGGVTPGMTMVRIVGRKG